MLSFNDNIQNSPPAKIACFTLLPRFHHSSSPTHTNTLTHTHPHRGSVRTRSSRIMGHATCTTRYHSMISNLIAVTQWGAAGGTGTGSHGYLKHQTALCKVSTYSSKLHSTPVLPLHIALYCSIVARILPSYCGYIF